MPECGTVPGYSEHYSPRGDKTPCEPCKAAYLKARKERFKRKYLMGRTSMHIPAFGAKRRIKALQRMGWAYKDIAREMGYTGRNGSTWLSKIVVRQQVIHINTFAAICGAYDRLCMTPGPSEHARRIAIRRRYAPPLAWDDDTIDNPKAKPQGMKDQRSVA